MRKNIPVTGWRKTLDKLLRVYVAETSSIVQTMSGGYSKCSILRVSSEYESSENSF